MTNYQTFWEWFSRVEQEIHSQLDHNPDHYASEILIHLQAVHPDIVFDIPFELVHGKHELILSADGDPNLFPIITELVEAAPNYTNWIIHNLRPATNQIDQAIELDGLYLEYEDIYYVLHNQSPPYNIDVYIRGYDQEDNRYVHGYFLLLDTLIGEYQSVTKINQTKVHPLDEMPKYAKRLLTIRDII